jgi:hypothetical protein
MAYVCAQRVPNRRVDIPICLTHFGQSPPYSDVYHECSIDALRHCYRPENVVVPERPEVERSCTEPCASSTGMAPEPEVDQCNAL